MELVTIRHPRIDADAIVPASAIRQHRRAGWKPVSERDKSRAAAPRREQVPNSEPATTDRSEQ